ncbi:PRC-barrel domain-containing protein [Marivita sp. S2033]|uniref:PRC-barrel domain-containing protein n=1 Tax=Marivita sp. S2033 TaxID=3373187 RepID=UPI003982841E
MKHFLTTTATALILSTSAYAANHTGAFIEMSFDEAVNLNASEMIGMRVYATEAELNNETTVAADGEKDWDDIGEINEIVLTRDGTVRSVIVGVGGFLGMGEKDVAVDMSQLKFISEDGEAGEFFLVLNANAAGLEEAPAYEYDRDMQAMETNTLTTEANDMDANDVNVDTVTTDMNDRPMMAPPAVEREGYSLAERDTLTTENLTGARVYGVNDEDVGEVSELLLNDDGTIDRAILDIGGFLGMGEHQIAVTLDELQIVRTDAGDDIRVYIDSTQEALEAQPEYQD